MAFLTILGVTEIICSFRLVLKGQTGKEITELSTFKFFKKFLANNFALSDAEDNTSRPLNRGIADLPLLRMLLAICRKCQETIFWEAIDSFVLLAYASMAALRTLSQQLLARNLPKQFWCLSQRTQSSNSILIKCFFQAHQNKLALSLYSK